MPREIRLLDGILLHMNHGMAALSGVTNDRGLDFLAILLVHRAFASLWRAREDAILRDLEAARASASERPDR